MGLYKHFQTGAILRRFTGLAELILPPGVTSDSAATTVIPISLSAKGWLEDSGPVVLSCGLEQECGRWSCSKHRYTYKPQLSVPALFL